MNGQALASLLEDPDRELLRCRDDGMSRQEAEAWARSLFVESFGDDDRFFGWVKTIADGMDPYDIHYRIQNRIHRAIHSTFPRSPVGDVDRLCRFIQANLSTDVETRRLIDAIPPLVWSPEGRDWQALSGASVDDVGGQINVGYLQEQWLAFSVDGYAGCAARRIRPRQARERYGAKEFPYSMSAINFWTDRARGALVTDVCIGSMSGRPGTWSSKELDGQLDCCIGLQLTCRYQWLADIRIDRSPTIRLLMGPHEAKEIFRLREIEDGAKRRSALLHIVRAHARRKRHTENDTVEVREHLKGKETLKWSGCEVRLSPPQFDRERLAR
jgi:hypothetical protein